MKFFLKQLKHLLIPRFYTVKEGLMIFWLNYEFLIKYNKQ